MRLLKNIGEPGSDGSIGRFCAEFYFVLYDVVDQEISILISRAKRKAGGVLKGREGTQRRRPSRVIGRWQIWSYRGKKISVSCWRSLLDLDILKKGGKGTRKRRGRNQKKGTKVGRWGENER